MAIGLNIFDVARVYVTVVCAHFIAHDSGLKDVAVSCASRNRKKNGMHRAYAFKVRLFFDRSLLHSSLLSRY